MKESALAPPADSSIELVPLVALVSFAAIVPLPVTESAPVAVICTAAPCPDDLMVPLLVKAREPVSDTEMFPALLPVLPVVVTVPLLEKLLPVILKVRL